MEGDLSLSQSFGGLRIANPDDIPSGGSEEQSILTPRPRTADSQRGKDGMCSTISSIMLVLLK